MLWLALLTLSLLLCGKAEEDGKEYYVVPSNVPESSSPSCHPLTYYAENQTEYFLTNSTYIFLPGEHILKPGTNITVKDVSKLSLRAKFNDTAKDVCGYEWKDVRPVINCQRGDTGFVFINVSDLEIQGLDVTYCGHFLRNSTTSNYTQIWSALSLTDVTDFKLVDTHITKSRGYGILGQNIFGESFIKNCVLKENKGGCEPHKCVHGGNIAVRYNTSCNNVSSYFHITKSNITDGYSVSYSSGLDLIINCIDGGIHFVLNQVILSRNIGNDHNEASANLDFQMFAFPKLGNTSNSVRINGCTIEQGYSYFASGMSASIYINSSATTHGHSGADNLTVLQVNNTKFLNNTSRSPGSGLHMKLYYTNELLDTQVGIEFHNCHFEHNRLETEALEQRGGVAVHIVTFKVVENELHSTPQYMTLFNNCKFSNNSLLYHPSLSSGAIYIEEHANVIIKDCTISDNNNTGITAVHSYIRFTGKNVIERNSAINGGGVLLHSNAIMLLSEHSTLFIENNNATEHGGGIHAEFGMHSAVPPCFFQFDAVTLLNETRRITAHVSLQNNSAKTGTAVYGGRIDTCYFLVDNTPWRNKYLLGQHSGHIFNETFHYVPTPTAISSDPIKVCLCSSTYINCSTSVKVVNISPGETFSVNATVVGQRNGSASGIVIADFFHQNSDVQIDYEEDTQQVNPNCTLLKYTVKSHKEGIQANLSLHVSAASSYSAQYPKVVINVVTCRMGFTLNNTTGTCDCVPLLTKRHIHCNPKDLTIHRPKKLWIGYDRNFTSITDILVKRCPRAYCKQHETDIKSHKGYIDQDFQCNFKRKGLFCGKCMRGLSIVFGTPRCVYCNANNRWALFGSVCGFALAGIILVAFLFACNFTITEGTINGFIFYANIIEINQDIYFPLKSHSSLDSQVYLTMRTFIAWLNLDIGAETCFFDGMTTFHKTWLQFVFPIYIWLIVGSLIWLSRNSTLITRLMKNNGTKVLATLMLLSYAKLMRAIVASFAGMHIGPNSHVWYYDGSQPYFEGVHMLLFLNAILFSVVLLPFTLVLLFIKQLPRLTSLKMLRWLNKLKPLFDAFTGPYMDEYRFWVGLKLLTRIMVLILGSTITDDVFVLLVVIATCALLLSANYFYGTRIYKKRSVNIIEALLLLNLMLWSMTSIYCRNSNECMHNAVYPFSGSTLLALFVVIIRYHLYKPNYFTYACEKFWSCLVKISPLVFKKRSSVITNGCESEQAQLLSVAASPGTTYSEFSIPSATSDDDSN